MKICYINNLLYILVLFLLALILYNAFMNKINYDKNIEKFYNKEVAFAVDRTGELLIGKSSEDKKLDDVKEHIDYVQGDIQEDIDDVQEDTDIIVKQSDKIQQQLSFLQDSVDELSNQLSQQPQPQPLPQPQPQPQPYPKPLP